MVNEVEIAREKAGEAGGGVQGRGREKLRENSEPQQVLRTNPERYQQNR